jgi:hypothetical protein
MAHPIGDAIDHQTLCAIGMNSIESPWNNRSSVLTDRKVHDRHVPEVR